MEKRIGITILSFWIFQSIAILICHKIFCTDINIFSSYLINNLLWHIILLFFLLLHKNEFVTVPDNKPLEKINLANLLSLCRLSSIPLVTFLLRNYTANGIKTILATTLIFIFITDFLDGLIARTCNQITKIGKMIDSMGDYALLTLISIVYYDLKILPDWFLYLILSRLLLQAFGVMLFMILKYPVEIKSTSGGKITIASTMLLYSVKLAILFFTIPPTIIKYFTIAEYLCGIVIFIFIFEKLNIFYKHYIKYKKKQGL